MTKEQRGRPAPHQERRRGTRGWGAAAALVISVLASGSVLSCTGTADDNKLPPNVQDPATLKTPSGAVARYRGTLAYLGGAFDRVMTSSGILTDELAALPASVTVAGPFTPLDARLDPSIVSQSLSDALHRLRGEAHEARGFLAAYAPDSSPALQGHLYAVEGYTEVWLADLFCSGIPLSTVDFEGNYTLAAGSTTSEVYRHAVALFDSALALTSDSVPFQQVAAVGKGRALLALGQYAEAAAAVSAVPDDYSYPVVFVHQSSAFREQPDSALLWYFREQYRQVAGIPRVADREGQNGLDYRTSGDPRTAVLALGPDALGDTMYFPAKYPETDAVTFTLANGIEARLIEAEAALQANPDDGRWLAILNHLRQTAWPTIVPAVTGPLPDLADPGLDPAGKNTLREDLLFRERAFWLYLTGHRQGDLRRLIRNYGRASQDVYPAGQNYPGGTGAYGSEIVIPVPQTEQQLNPKYTGCFHRNA